MSVELCEVQEVKNRFVRGVGSSSSLPFRWLEALGFQKMKDQGFIGMSVPDCF